MQYDHQKLGLSFAELGALLGTRAMLAEDMLKHTRHPLEDLEANPAVHFFTMNTTCATKYCGSVACIGGTMAQIMGMDSLHADNYVREVTKNQPIHRLFYPPIIGEDAVNWNDITPEIAVQAIDRFLAGKAINWPELVSDSYRKAAA